MKRILALLVAALMLTAIFAGCTAQQTNTNTETLPDDVLAGQFTFPTLKPPTIREPEEETTADPDALPPIEIKNYQVSTNTNTLKSNSGDLKYVMIYNPEIYDENVNYNIVKTTGSLKGQIDVNMGRADGLENDKEQLTISQDEMLAGIPFDEINWEGDRAGGSSTVYKVGDKKVFYTYDNVSTSNPRISQNFTCSYAGKYCNIWVAQNSLTSTLAKDYGTSFDNDVYTQMVETFGEPRFADIGGKVNLLYYPLPTGLGGCFAPMDLFTANEIKGSSLENAKCNTDHAVFHMNASYANNPANKLVMTSTMAHEFQHLICFTDYFYTLSYTMTRTWMNEAMSGYVEEMLFPGSKVESGHINSFLASDLIRKGQSLYNFTTIQTASATDIGVYGNVYLFSEYLARLAGDDVFSNFHNYWRTSYSVTLSESEAIANSVPQDVYDAIDLSITYPDDVFIIYETDVWMSKLVLHYYLDMLNDNDTDPAAFTHVKNENLFYNEINATQIEGGGRVLIALTGNTFTIPSDAASGLIYVGLNEDFEVVTPLVYK